MPDFIIEAVGLRKNFRKVKALNGLNLNVPRGSIFGFLGRNGSGKTTTIKILMGMVKPSSGRMNVFGLDPTHPTSGVAIRRRVGFVNEDKQLYAGMNVTQMLHFTRPFFPGWNHDLEKNLLTLFELPLKQKISRLSKGMKTRLAVLLALARGAELLVLDEPSSGLDPAMTEAVLQKLVSLAAAGATIFFSTHHLEEVEQIADHVCIIEKGEDVVQGALDDLKQRHRRIQLIFSKEVPPASFNQNGIRSIKQAGRTLTLLTNKNVEKIVEQAHALNAVSVDVKPVTLKEIFLDQANAGNLN